MENSLQRKIRNITAGTLAAVGSLAFLEDVYAQTTKQDSLIDLTNISSRSGDQTKDSSNLPPFTIGDIEIKRTMKKVGCVEFILLHKTKRLFLSGKLQNYDSFVGLLKGDPKNILDDGFFFEEEKNSWIVKGGQKIAHLLIVILMLLERDLA